MDIRIGDVVKYRTLCNTSDEMGMINEIVEVKGSVNSERIGEKEYCIDTFKVGVFPVRISEKEIKAVYRNVESEVEQ